MEPESEPRRRGRPQKITREAIARAGRRMTLPQVTIAGIAEELGVGVRSLYKHTSGIADIQVITAEEIFAEWQAPPPGETPLDRYLLETALSLRRLALDNPGIAGFLVRTSLDVSSRVLQRMDAHHQDVARAYGLALPRASVLLAAVSEHALSVTDVVNSNGGRHRDYARMARTTELPALSTAARERKTHDEDAFFRFATTALIRGLLDETVSETDA